MRNLTKKSSFHNKSFSRLTGYSQKRLRETQIWLLKYQKLEYFYGELQGNDTVRQRLRKRDGHFTDKAQDAALRADHSEFNYKL